MRMSAPGLEEKPPAYSPPPGPQGYQPLPQNAPYPPPGHYPAGYGSTGGSYQDGAPPMFTPAAGQVPSYMQGQSAVVVTQQPSVVIVGGCPACRVGVLEDDFTCLGVCCAIFFFPLGLICCLLLRQRRCPNCGAVFS